MRRRRRIQHRANVVVGGNILSNPEKGVCVAVPKALLHRLLVRKERGKLHEKYRKPTHPDPLHGVTDVLPGSIVRKIPHPLTNGVDHIVEFKNSWFRFEWVTQWAASRFFLRML